MKERIEIITKTLNFLYPDPKVPLSHKDSYTLLVATVLSARCTDKVVNKITQKLFSLADNPKDMIKMTPDEIREIIRPCGLSKSKSQAIFDFSKEILEKYDNCVPQTFEILETFPGVGHKTASVVMSQAFNKPAFPVDTHVHRLAKRWKLSEGKSVNQTEGDLKSLFPESKWGILHLQMIFFGREHCSSRGCDGKSCIICNKINK